MTVKTMTFSAPPFDEGAALRYAGCRTAEPELSVMMRACAAEAWDSLSYRLCWCELPAETQGDRCLLGPLSLRSSDLAASLHGCDRVILMAATVGVGIDRLIVRFGRLSPAKAVMMQALGAERIEALCDAFCLQMSREYGAKLRPRFSPGYGDLALSTQKDIFALLDCPRRIGLTLNDSLLMSPTKSVTAFIGIERAEQS